MVKRNSILKTFGCTKNVKVLYEDRNNLIILLERMMLIFIGSNDLDELLVDVNKMISENNRVVRIYINRECKLNIVNINPTILEKANVEFYNGIPMFNDKYLEISPVNTTIEVSTPNEIFGGKKMNFILTAHIINTSLQNTVYDVRVFDYVNDMLITIKPKIAKWLTRTANNATKHLVTTWANHEVHHGFFSRLLHKIIKRKTISENEYIQHSEYVNSFDIDWSSCPVNTYLSNADRAYRSAMEPKELQAFNNIDYMVVFTLMYKRDF